MSVMIFRPKCQLLYKKNKINIAIAKIENAKMDMFITILNRIRNKCIRKNFELMNIAKKLKKIN